MAETKGLRSGGRMPGKFYRFKYETGDIVTMKKKHPCGFDTWEILSAGADIRLKCCGCGHIMTASRETVEKATMSVAGR